MTDVAVIVNRRSAYEHVYPVSAFRFEFLDRASPSVVYSKHLKNPLAKNRSDRAVRDQPQGRVWVRRQTWSPNILRHLAMCPPYLIKVAKQAMSAPLEVDPQGETDAGHLAKTLDPRVIKSKFFASVADGSSEPRNLLSMKNLCGLPSHIY